MKYFISLSSGKETFLQRLPRQISRCYFKNIAMAGELLEDKNAGGYLVISVSVFHWRIINLLSFHNLGSH